MTKEERKFWQHRFEQLFCESTVDLIEKLNRESKREGTEIYATVAIMNIKVRDCAPTQTDKEFLHSCGILTNE